MLRMMVSEIAEVYRNQVSPTGVQLNEMLTNVFFFGLEQL